jgi:phosphoadenosine phosphosulfate reductase
MADALKEESLTMAENLDIPLLNARFEGAAAEEILAWAWETFGSTALVSSSFQTQSVPLLHLVSRVCPEMPVIFIDTGFHFPETLTFRDRLQATYHLNVMVLRPTMTQSELFQQYGEGLYRRDPDLCCYINKVSPMQWAVSRAKAWISGVRRDQTANRQAMKVLEPQASGLLQIHPLLNWTKDDVRAYHQAHDLIVHPLYHLGYVSVGCAPCTRPVFFGENERAGRWADSEKNECGLHLDWTEEGQKHG